MKSNFVSRRKIIKGVALGTLAVSLPSLVWAKNSMVSNSNVSDAEKRGSKYPAIDDEIVSDVVGKSHFDLEGLKILVDKRPELSKACWDWRFGDFETAIGAASHVGRRDIAEYLISRGARPDLFTWTMLGAFEIVKSTIELSPGIQKIEGPHGISLLDHAHAGLRMKDKMTQKNIEDSKKLIAYLESLGDADGKKYLEVKEGDKEKYLGDYKYGLGEKEGFTVGLNMRKTISLGEIGGFGGSLYKISENRFTYQGAPSVEVMFQIENEEVKSLTLYEPDSTLIAKKLSK